MKIVICVASYTHDRLLNFLDTIYSSISGSDDVLLIIETGDPYLNLEGICAGKRPRTYIYEIERKERTFTQVTYEMIEIASMICDDNTIFMILDNDYHINPHALNFARLIMGENPEVNFLSLLRGPGTNIEKQNLITLSGFNFFKWDTCMGGSSIFRWKEVCPLLKKFFEMTGISKENTGESWAFDIDFYGFIKKEIQDPLPIYTTYDFSLVQHCNLVSGVLNTRAGIYDHLYAMNYDPRCDPFEFRKYS